MKGSEDILVEHCLATLPDSIAARKQLLRAVLHSINSKHPEYRRVTLMLSYLVKHEAEQANLPLHRNPGNPHPGDLQQEGDGQ